jgi:hypothetical protein
VQVMAGERNEDLQARPNCIILGDQTDEEGSCSSSPCSALLRNAVRRPQTCVQNHVRGTIVQYLEVPSTNKMSPAGLQNRGPLGKAIKLVCSFGAGGEMQCRAICCLVDSGLE